MHLSFGTHSNVCVLSMFCMIDTNCINKTLWKLQEISDYTKKCVLKKSI